MYFGGTIKNYKPNIYIKQDDDRIAHYDHLWAGFEDDPERKKMIQRQLADDLKRQMAEKRGREDNKKTTYDTEQKFSTSKNNYNSTISNYTTYKPINFTRTVPMSSTLPVNTSNNFAENLRAQIDDCRRSSYSALSHTISPLSVTQPIPTFVPTTFDSTQFGMPNLSHILRSNKSTSGRQSQIRSISMNETSSLRSSLDQSSQAPKINDESPLNRSKVITPSIGFSTRNMKSNKNTAFFQDISPNPTSLQFSSTSPSINDTQTNLSTKYQGFNVASLSNTLQPTHQEAITIQKPKLLCESQMIYPDGHLEPL